MSSTKTLFDESYYINSKTSNYVDYRKHSFDGQTDEIIKLIKPDIKDTFVDFGCATGGLMKSFIDRGYIHIKGTDISLWAVKYGKNILGLGDKICFYNLNILTETPDYIFAFDVFEHLPDFELDYILTLMRMGLQKKILMRVPISRNEGEDYYFEVSRNDKTHIQVHDRKWWFNKLKEADFKYIDDLKGKHIYSSKGVFAGIFE